MTNPSPVPCALMLHHCLKACSVLCYQTLSKLKRRNPPALPVESVSGLLSSCMCAEHFAFQLQSSLRQAGMSRSFPSLTQSSQALLAQETTKSHHYLDYIMGPPTHAVCPRYSKLGCFNTSQTLDLVHCGAVWVRTKQDYRCVCVCVWKRERACLQCVFPSSSSSSGGGQTSLLAVMLSEGGERAGSHCSCIPAAGTQNAPAVALSGAAKWLAVTRSKFFISAWCGQHFRYLLWISGVSASAKKVM